MDLRPVNCRWPHCADYDERCQTGVNIPCIVIEGENLELARLAADEPFPYTPWEIGKVMAVIAILGIVWFALCAMQMEIPV